MIWKIEYKSLNEGQDYYITNGEVSFQTNSYEDAKWLCGELNWVFKYITKVRSNNANTGS